MKRLSCYLHEYYWPNHKKVSNILPNFPPLSLTLVAFLHNFPNSGVNKQDSRAEHGSVEPHVKLLKQSL